MNKQVCPLQEANIVWRDGLPYSTDYQDIYFSQDDPIGESRHVFIAGNRLTERFATLSSVSFCIGEIGFGTGLNFLLTAYCWQQQAPTTARLFYYSCELHPLKRDDLARCLQLWPELAEFSQVLLSQWPPPLPGYHEIVFAQGRIHLILLWGDAQAVFAELGDETEQRLAIDAWFLDGFAPNRHEGVWQKSLFASLAALTATGGTLATFTACGWVRRLLADVGFYMQRDRGFGRKWHMLTGYFGAGKCGAVRQKQPILVIGAGFAGALVAYFLAERGFKVIVLDENTTIAGAASGNHQAVIYPQLSAYQSPMTTFMLHAFLFATRFYQQKEQAGWPVSLTGLLQLNEKNRIIWRETFAALPQLLRYVDSQEATAIAGLPVQQDAFWIPQAGILNMPAFCEQLLAHDNITWRGGVRVSSLQYHDGQWQAGEWRATQMVLACGMQMATFLPYLAARMKAVKGQMSYIATSEHSRLLRVPFCGQGHVLPETDGLHALGASYRLGQAESACTRAEDIENLNRLRGMPLISSWSTDVVQSWSGVRAMVTDYMPLVGRLDAGLYVCGGFGSRASVSAPLAARFLAGLMTAEPPVVPKWMAARLSPRRFQRGQKKEE